MFIHVLTNSALAGVGISRAIFTICTTAVVQIVKITREIPGCALDWVDQLTSAVEASRLEETDRSSDKWINEAWVGRCRSRLRLIFPALLHERPQQYTALSSQFELPNGVKCGINPGNSTCSCTGQDKPVGKKAEKLQLKFYIPGAAGTIQ